MKYFVYVNEFNDCVRVSKNEFNSFITSMKKKYLVEVDSVIAPCSTDYSITVSGKYIPLGFSLNI